MNNKQEPTEPLPPAAGWAIRHVTAAELWERLKSKRGHRMLVHGSTPDGCLSVWPEDIPVEWTITQQERDKLDALFEARRKETSTVAPNEKGGP